MKKVFFNFYNAEVELESEWTEILDYISKDFSVFKTDQLKNKKYLLKIKINKEDSRNQKIPKLVSSMQSLNSVTYQQNEIRYNDYYGKLLSVFNYENESAEIFSQDENKTHEVVYLLILSRVGKYLDLNGLHKLHAFAISYRGLAFVCMMPSKGGKSTLLLELLKNEKVKMISDDIPLINSKGCILPFPIKIGLDVEAKLPFEILNPEENIYFLNREQYGKKRFISLVGVKDKIEKTENVFENIIIAEGFRFRSENTEIIPSSWLKTFLGLFKHGVIGFGLPMILEYFWEFGISDFYVKTNIFLKRFCAFFMFSLKAKKVSLSLGSETSNSAQKIIEYLDSLK